MRFLNRAIQLIQPPQRTIPAACVLSQPLLIIVQHILLLVLLMPEERSTSVRVILSAILMLVAIFCCIKRKPETFLVTYLITVAFLLLTCIIFPQNAEVLVDSSLRFLLPMVVSSALCVVAVGDIYAFDRVFSIMSWICFLFSMLIILSFYKGILLVEHYSLSLSYALLVVMIGLYSQRHIMAKIASFLVAVIVVAIGSRGALVFFGLYIIYDILRNHKKLIFPAIICFFLVLGVLTQFADWLYDYGIDSRTLRTIADGSFGESDGRDSIYSKSFDIFWENCLIGIGLFGDRVRIGGYCHNLFLEILLDFGLFIGSILIIIMVVSYLKLLFISTREIKDLLVKYTLAFIAPLMLSGSYLQDYNFGIFVGIFILLLKENKNQLLICEQSNVGKHVK